MLAGKQRPTRNCTSNLQLGDSVYRQDQGTKSNKNSGIKMGGVYVEEYNTKLGDLSSHGLDRLETISDEEVDDWIFTPRWTLRYPCPLNTCYEVTVDEVCFGTQGHLLSK